MKSQLLRVRYINSAETEFSFEMNSNNPLQNLMEIIRDYGYEDWGECRGRAWCRTCHIRVEPVTNSSELPSNVIEHDEEAALSELDTRYSNSRLACQLVIEPALDDALLTHVGDS